MKKLGTIAAVFLIIAALMLTSGCLPKWTIVVSRSAQSSLLFDANDLDSAVVMAPDEFTFLIFDVSLTNNGLLESDIREDLIFAVYDETSPLARYTNYYNQSAFDIFDEMEYVVGGKATNEGSIFVTIPSDMNPTDRVFVIMKPNFDVLYWVRVTDLPFVSDYPDSW